MTIGCKLLSPASAVGLRGVVVVQRDGALRTFRGADMAKTKSRASAKARSGTKGRSNARRGQAVCPAQGAAGRLQSWDLRRS
jgi:hypothetical protein